MLPRFYFCKYFSTSGLHLLNDGNFKWMAINRTERFWIYRIAFVLTCRECLKLSAYWPACLSVCVDFYKYPLATWEIQSKRFRANIKQHREGHTLSLYYRHGVTVVLWRFGLLTLFALNLEKCTRKRFNCLTMDVN